MSFEITVDPAAMVIRQARWALLARYTKRWSMAKYRAISLRASERIRYEIV